MLFVRTILLAAQATALAVGSAGHGYLEVRDDEQASQQVVKLAEQAYAQTLEALGGDSSLDARTSSSCTPKNLRIRKEWGSLTKCEQKDYIKAVKCLQSKPSITPPLLAPGAKSRFDDIIVTHYNQTPFVHYTANFLAWHRYLLHLYEGMLHDECGYNGTQPYWDWAKTARTGLHASPIFDGSDTSLSGDGEHIPDQGPVILAGPIDPPIILDAGPGGGCVTSGPFKNLTVNLGPAALQVANGGEAESAANPLDWNPRCLRRSLTDSVNRRHANGTGVLNAVVGHDDVYDFQMTVQGYPGTGELGVHGGGHYSMGGDPGRDVFISPGDPAFYLHHGMIDRLWWIWQSQKPSERTKGPKALIGTNTFLNDPPSANATYDDYVNYGYAAGPPRQLKEIMSTTAGPFCYVYL